MYRGQAASLKLEVERLREILVREMGETELQAILNGEKTGWTGRTEQVEVLQQTVQYLQGLLDTRQPSAQADRYWADTEVEERDRRSRSSSVSVPSPSYRKPAKRGSISNGRRESANSSRTAALDNSGRGSEFLAQKCADLDTLRKASDVEKRRLEELVRLLTSRLSVLEQRAR